ncbi:protein phosphatase 1H-like [Oppia nitens]|uniref:protein phosphatase 1H-like n=1 Tax=Oppia nitens TaxID=1686743 RepID=UPI0023DA66A9|nr:protein phosphatase 1H-like [Oppia nitens]
MFNRFKSAINNVINNLEPNSGLANGAGDAHVVSHHSSQSGHTSGPPLKFRYTRPEFLLLQTDDEIQVSADHIMRPIIVPRDISRLPFNAGYAETINAGKSVRNEDHAAVYRGTLKAVVSDEMIANKVSDMMSTVPGHPHQIPIGNKRNTHQKTISKANEANEKSKDISDSNISDGKEVKAFNGNDISDQVSDNKDQTAVTADPQTLPLNESTTNPSVDDLMSPSIPIPIEERLAEAISDTIESAYATPETSPQKTQKSIREESLPWLYFAVFDGHAGSGVAVAVSNTLHKIIEEKLQSIADLLIKFGITNDKNLCVKGINESESEAKQLNGSVVINQDNHLNKENIALLFHPSTEKWITVDNLITGALESAFWQMDNIIARDKRVYRMSGGCTACVGVFILGKLYVANAGDSRAIICKGKDVVPMSFDFTPESERERIKYLGLLKPELLGNDFTHLEFVRRPARRDLGKKLLYRDAFMSGWSYKTITIEDLKFPLIYGEGKRSRVLATIGVTRGFGDHELKAQNSDVDIKPFLTPQPEVRIYDLENDNKLTDADVLVIGTDGLWDITTNEVAADVINKSLDVFPANDVQRYKYRYISAAQDLVMHSRGKSRESGKGWKTVDNKTATIDDISVFVIPLKPYIDEYINWKSARNVVLEKPFSDR